MKEKPSPVDIITCNDIILLYRGTIGTLPLFDDQDRKSLFRFSLSRVREIASLRLVPITIVTTGAAPQKIQTAASCCIILESPAFGFLSHGYSQKCSFEDGMVSVMVVAPFSVVDYLLLIWNRLFLRWKQAESPHSIGFIKAPEITIEPESALSVIIDGEEMTTTPVRISVSRTKVRINHGLSGDLPGKAAVSNSEEISVQSLPSGKELQKARKRHLPVFAYASEERFKDLYGYEYPSLRTPSFQAVLDQNWNGCFSGFDDLLHPDPDLTLPATYE